MVLLKEKIRFELFLKRRMYLYIYGFKNGLIKFYTDSEKDMERFRNTYYGGIPLSIIFLFRRLVNGRCYDNATIAAYAFHDYEDVKQIDADVNSVKLNPANIEFYRQKCGYLPKNYGNHSFVEVTDENGVTWVIDTTNAYIMEKSLYYKIEQPKITKINDKQALLNFPDYQDLLEQDFEKDLKAIKPIMDIIDKLYATADHKQEIYYEAIGKEIELFKKRVNYDQIKKEYEAGVYGRK